MSTPPTPARVIAKNNELVQEWRTSIDDGEIVLYEASWRRIRGGKIKHYYWFKPANRLTAQPELNQVIGEHVPLEDALRFIGDSPALRNTSEKRSANEAFQEGADNATGAHVAKQPRLSAAARQVSPLRQATPPRQVTPPLQVAPPPQHFIKQEHLFDQGARPDYIRARDATVPGHGRSPSPSALSQVSQASYASSSKQQVAGPSNHGVCHMMVMSSVTNGLVGLAISNEMEE